MKLGEYEGMNERMHDREAAVLPAVLHPCRR